MKKIIFFQMIITDCFHLQKKISTMGLNAENDSDKTINDASHLDVLDDARHENLLTRVGLSVGGLVCPPLKPPRAPCQENHPQKCSPTHGKPATPPSQAPHTLCQGKGPHQGPHGPPWPVWGQGPSHFSQTT